MAIIATTVLQLVETVGEESLTIIGKSYRHAYLHFRRVIYLTACSNPQQARNSYNENGSGESLRENTATSGAPGTFFRNNERYNGSSSSGARYENRAAGANYKSRESNYRAGSGRFAGSASAAASQGSSNSGQRK